MCARYELYNTMSIFSARLTSCRIWGGVALHPVDLFAHHLIHLGVNQVYHF